ncbi:Gibberellin 2-beta-dioxygenase [Bertholletia excelsa]
MASSAHHQHLPTPYGGATTAPPPTPSTQQASDSSSDATADVLSGLLHLLPPTLSLPTRRSPPATATTPTASAPPISLSPQNTNRLSDILFSASKLGFFQLTHHAVRSELAQAAESESLSLVNLPREKKQLCFPNNWPVGFDDEDDDGDSFCLDSGCFTEPSSELSLGSLGEFSREMERVGLEVIEALACAVGFENPAREDPSSVCSLLWISEGNPGNKPVASGKFYPYAVGLHYQIRSQKHSLLADSGWVSVSPQVDSVLVTLGDIAQVWSNGKIKKVRGRPVPSQGDNNGDNARHVSMSLLVTLPLESTLSPLLPSLNVDGDEDEGNKDDGRWGFSSFSFEDYAWRVYHERLLLKDPLDRYRV